MPVTIQNAAIQHKFKFMDNFAFSTISTPFLIVYSPKSNSNVIYTAV